MILIPPLQVINNSLVDGNGNRLLYAGEDVAAVKELADCYNAANKAQPIYQPTPYQCYHCGGEANEAVDFGQYDTTEYQLTCRCCGAYTKWFRNRLDALHEWNNGDAVKQEKPILTVTIKRCACCGSTPLISTHSYVYIQCPNCGYTTSSHPSLSEAAEEWNALDPETHPGFQEHVNDELNKAYQEAMSNIIYAGAGL